MEVIEPSYYKRKVPCRVLNMFPVFKVGIFVHSN
jgi:hypothetical protein